MMVVVVMGVAGSGKSTVGPLLAQALGGDFAEGDKFHPAANVEKMSSGVPLDDADRKPWLAAMAAAIAEWSRKDRPTVLACSALKHSYRAILSGGLPEVVEDLSAVDVIYPVLRRNAHSLIGAPKPCLGRFSTSAGKSPA